MNPPKRHSKKWLKYFIPGAVRSRDAVIGSDVEVVGLFLLIVEMKSIGDDDLSTARVTVKQDNVERYGSNAGLVHRVATDPLCTYPHHQYIHS